MYWVELFDVSMDGKESVRIQPDLCSEKDASFQVL